MPNINNLVYTDTFKTWFDRTNSLISTVNGITVSNLLAGDGIGITSSNNLFTVSHGSLVNTGVTFAGNVKFTGNVSFSASPTISSTVIGITPKASGVTAGNVVRVDANGLTLAKADSATNAEVLGVVVGEDASSTVVALTGIVNNTNFADTIPNLLGIAGGTLTAGQVYFLSSSVAGGITTTEPSTVNQVSKPILLGITGNVGSVLPYRGAVIGVSGNNNNNINSNFIMAIDYSQNNPSVSVSGNTVKVGDVVLIVANGKLEPWFTGANDYSIFIKAYGRTSQSTYDNIVIFDNVGGAPLFLLETPPAPAMVPESCSKEYFGLVSKIISDDTSSKILTVEIVTPGNKFDVNISDLNPDIWNDVILNVPNTGNVNFIWLPGDLMFKPYSTDYEKYPSWGKYIITGANQATIILHDVGKKDFWETSTYLNNIQNELYNLQTQSLRNTTNENILINGYGQIQQYNNKIEITNSKTSNYVNPIIDGWYFTNCGITFSNLSIEGVTSTGYLKITSQYDNSPEKYPFLFYGLGFSGNGSPADWTDDQKTALQMLMMPAIENIQYISGDINTRQNYYYKFTVSGGNTCDYPTTLTLYPFINTYPYRPDNPAYSIGGITGALARRKFGTPITIGITVGSSTSSREYAGVYQALDSLRSSYPVYGLSGGIQEIKIGELYDNKYYDLWRMVNGKEELLNWGYHAQGSWVSFGIAFDKNFGDTLGSKTHTLQITKARATIGSIAPVAEHVPDPSLEYTKCKKYYQRSYPLNVSTRSNLATNTCTIVDVGNVGINDSARYVRIDFPVTMVRTPDTVILYSNNYGNTGEATLWNSYGWHGGSSRLDTKDISTGAYSDTKNIPWDPSGIRGSGALYAGQNIISSSKYSTGFYTWLQGAANGTIQPMDILYFHWVADGLFKDYMP